MGQAKKKPASMKVRRAVRTERDQVRDLARACGVPDAQVGNLGLAKIVDLSGELGERQKTYTVLVNRGGTAIDRWISGRCGQDDGCVHGEPHCDVAGAVESLSVFDRCAAMCDAKGNWESRAREGCGSLCLWLSRTRSN